MIHPSGMDLQEKQTAAVTELNNADHLQPLKTGLSPWSCSETSNYDGMWHNFGNFLIDKITLTWKIICVWHSFVAKFAKNKTKLPKCNSLCFGILRRIFGHQWFLEIPVLYLLQAFWNSNRCLWQLVRFNPHMTREWKIMKNDFNIATFLKLV